MLASKNGLLLLYKEGYLNSVSPLFLCVSVENLQNFLPEKEKENLKWKLYLVFVFKQLIDEGFSRSFEVFSSVHRFSGPHFNRFLLNEWKMEKKRVALMLMDIHDERRGESGSYFVIKMEEKKKSPTQTKQMEKHSS